MKVDLQKNIINTGLLTFGIVLVAFSFYKLNNPLHYNTELSSQLGNIANYQSDVRIKKTNHFEWTNLFTTQNPVAANDKIFSNKGSQAEVNFLAGHKLTIQENSLVRIKDSQQIKIERGNISLELKKGKKPFILMLGKKKIKIKATDNSQIKVSYQEETNITVAKGSIELLENDGAIAIAENESIQITNKQKIQKISTLFPKNETVYTANQTAPIRFQISGAQKEAKILIADNLSLDNSIQLDQSSEHNLKPGKYFWKIGDSEVETFKVIQNLPIPHITYPMANEKLIFAGDTSQLKIKISPIEMSTPVQVIITNKEHKLIAEKQYNTTSIIFPGLAAGDYFIKARFLANFRQSSWSEAIPITLAPFKFTKDKAMVIELNRPNQKVKFEWNKKKKDLTVFAIAKDPNFQNIIITKRIRSKSSTEVNFPVIGTYYWRVQKESKDGTLSAQTPVQVIIKPTPPPARPKSLPSLKLKLKVKRAKPKSVWFKIFNFVFPSAYASDTKDSIRVDFPFIKDAKEYEIEIYKDEKLKEKVFKIKTKHSQFEWTPRSGGTFYYRMRYRDYWDRYSEFSLPSTLQIDVDYLPSGKTRFKTKPKKIAKKAKPRKKVQKKISTLPTPKTHLNKFSFLAGPSSLDHGHKSDQKMEISGLMYNTLSLAYLHKVKHNWFQAYEVNYQSNAGTVFDNQDFILRQASFALPLNHYYLTPSIQFKQVSSYAIENSEVKYDKSSHVINIGLKYGMPVKLGKKHNLLPEIGLNLLSSTDYFLGLSYDYQTKNQYHFLLKTQFYNSTNSIDNETVRYQYIQLLAGAGYSF